MGLKALVYFVLKFKFTIAQIQGLKYTDIIHIQMDNIFIVRRCEYFGGLKLTTITIE